MFKSDLVAFFAGFVLSCLVASGIYMYVVWDSLYPSLCNLYWGDVAIIAFGMAIPAMLLMLLNMIVRDTR